MSGKKPRSPTGDSFWWYKHVPAQFIMEAFPLLPEERGAYAMLLSLECMKGGLPNDKETLSKMIMAPVSDSVIRLFKVGKDGLLFSEMVKSSRDAHSSRSTGGRNGGIKSGQVRAAKAAANSVIIVDQTPKSNAVNGKHNEGTLKEPSTNLQGGFKEASRRLQGGLKHEEKSREEKNRVEKSKEDNTNSSPDVEEAAVEEPRFELNTEGPSVKRNGKAKKAQQVVAPPASHPGPFHVWLGVNQPGADLPPNLHTPECASAAKKWVTYRAAERKKRYGIMSLAEEIKCWEAFPASAFPSYVDDSIKYQRLSVCPPKFPTNSSASFAPTFQALDPDERVERETKAKADRIAKLESECSLLESAIKAGGLSEHEAMAKAATIDWNRRAISNLSRELDSSIKNPVPA